MRDDATDKAAINELAKNRAVLESSRVSGVVPDNQHLRAVPRFGGKPIAKTDIDEEFRGLVKAAADHEGESKMTLQAKGPWRHAALVPSFDQKGASRV